MATHHQKPDAKPTKNVVARRRQGQSGQEFEWQDHENEFSSLQRAVEDPQTVSADDILRLQRFYGNREVSPLLTGAETTPVQPGAADQGGKTVIQARLTVGPVGDKYEQEADRVADQVMRMPTPAGAPGAGSQSQPVQRQPEEEELLQTKSLAASITPVVQRQEMEEEELQLKPAEMVQRQEMEEEELQMKPAETVQRQEMEEEELQMKPAETVQRQEMEEEELQLKPAETVQRQEMEEEELQLKPAEMVQRQEMEEEELLQTKSKRKATQRDGSFEADREVEQRLGNLKGSGAPLPDDLRTDMEARFGTGFSGVRVHADGEAARLNQELKAQAFTHGRDVYFASGKYDPGSNAGKRLLAHELTHVIQQTGNQTSSQNDAHTEEASHASNGVETTNEPALSDRLVTHRADVLQRITEEELEEQRRKLKKVTPEERGGTPKGGSNSLLSALSRVIDERFVRSQEDEVNEDVVEESEWEDEEKPIKQPPPEKLHSHPVRQSGTFTSSEGLSSSSSLSSPIFLPGPKMEDLAEAMRRRRAQMYGDEEDDLDVDEEEEEVPVKESLEKTEEKETEEESNPLHDPMDPLISQPVKKESDESSKKPKEETDLQNVPMDPLISQPVKKESDESSEETDVKTEPEEHPKQESQRQKLTFPRRPRGPKGRKRPTPPRELRRRRERKERERTGRLTEEDIKEIQAEHRPSPLKLRELESSLGVGPKLVKQTGDKGFFTNVERESEKPREVDEEHRRKIKALYRDLAKRHRTDDSKMAEINEAYRSNDIVKLQTLAGTGVVQEGDKGFMMDTTSKEAPKEVSDEERQELRKLRKELLLRHRGDESKMTEINTAFQANDLAKLQSLSGPPPAPDLPPFMARTAPTTKDGKKPVSLEKQLQQQRKKMGMTPKTLPEDASGWERFKAGSGVKARAAGRGLATAGRGIGTGVRGLGRGLAFLGGGVYRGGSWGRTSGKAAKEASASGEEALEVSRRRLNARLNRGKVSLPGRKENGQHKNKVDLRAQWEAEKDKKEEKPPSMEDFMKTMMGFFKGQQNGDAPQSSAEAQQKIDELEKKKQELEKQRDALKEKEEEK